MDSQRISPQPIDQIKIPDQKPAKYAGIESGKETKILNSHGKLAAHWGRKIENFLDIERINPKKTTINQKRHEFQKLMTNRRVELLTQEVKERSDHIDSILNLPDSIPENCNYINRNEFQKLVQSDVKEFLSYEIRSCNSGEKLIKLYEEVIRLRDKKFVPPKIIDPLLEKINNQMAVLVDKMPNHLRSISHDKEQPQTLELTKYKCNAVKGLLDTAKKINDNLYQKHRKALRNMMIVMFSEDVEKVTTACKARNNLKENKELSDEIKTVRDSIVYPFFQKVSSTPGEHFKKVEINTDKQIKELEAEREIIPNIIKKLNKTLINASKTVENEAKAMKAKQNILNKKRKTQNTESENKKLHDREARKFSEFKKQQEAYIKLYGDLISRLEQFNSSTGIYFEDEPTPESASPAHPEVFLTAYRKVELTESWKNLQNLDPMDTNSNLALKSFNHACFASHFQKIVANKQDWLPEGEIEKLKNSVQESVTASSVQKETYDQLVVAETACLLARQAHKKATDNETKKARKNHQHATRLQGSITPEQLDKAKQLRMLHAQSVATNRTDRMDVDARPDNEVDKNNNHSLSSSFGDPRDKASAANDAKAPQNDVDANTASGIHHESAAEKQQTFGVKGRPLPPIPRDSNTTQIRGVENQSDSRRKPQPPRRGQLAPLPPTRPAPPPPLPSGNTAKSGGAKDQTGGNKHIPAPPPPPPLPSGNTAKSVGDKDQTGGNKHIPAPPPPPPLPSGNTTKSGGDKDQTGGSKRVPPAPPRPPAPSAGGRTKKGSSDVKAQEQRSALLSDIRNGKKLNKLPEGLKRDRSAVKFNEGKNRNQDKAPEVEKRDNSAANSKQPGQESMGVDIAGALEKAFIDKGFLTKALKKRREDIEPDEWDS